MVILGPFWLKMAWFGSFEHYNWLNMGQYVCLRLSIGEYQWDVVISMDNYHVYHTWPSKLALNGQFLGKFHSIWANLSHSLVGSLWSGASHNMKKLLCFSEISTSWLILAMFWMFSLSNFCKNGQKWSFWGHFGRKWLDLALLSIITG